MGTNYGRNIIRELGKLTLENERLVAEHKRLEVENEDLRRQMADFKAMMEATVSQLTSEIERLKAQINKDSSNSSKPPSMDGFKRVPNSRQSSGRKSGGQVGHAGKRLQLPEHLDELVEKGLARREIKDHTNGATSFVTRYTLDIDITLVVTEHRYNKGNVPLGGEVTYGDKIKALVAILSTEGIIAQKRLSNFFSEITQGAINLSDGAIESFLSELAQKLDVEMDAIKTILLNGPVMHVDETPERCTQKPDYRDEEAVLRQSSGTSFNAYIRTHSSTTATLYTVNPQKDDDGIKRDGILSRYIGIISQDHEAKFYKYGTAHATCGAHLLRELRGMFELQKIPWADEMRWLIANMNKHKNADIAAKINSCDELVLSDFDSAYDLLLAKGRATLTALKKKELGYDELRRMLNRLYEYKDCYLLFIRNYRAPFTNNQAERDLRPCKIKQKVSGCFRSWAGIERYVKIRSFISTLKKRGRHLLDSIASVLQGSTVIRVAE